MRISYSLLVFLFGVCFANKLTAQVTNVVVERYYVSDANDATDTLGNITLDPGTVTYRVYVELKPGSKLRAIFGDANHPIKIESTLPFYNNEDRPNAVFGYQLNKNWFDDNATIALDSWLTLGVAAFQSTTQYFGVLKTEDSDGSFIGGVNNTGGTAFIPGGILNYNDPTASPSLSVADGYMVSANNLGQWLDLGFKNIAGEDTTIFGLLNTGSSFISNASRLQQNNPITPLAGNKVLVGQFTTKGDLSFKLNVEVEEPTTTGTTVVKYVADNTSLQPGEILSPFLTYPPLCGCKDPDYLEFSPLYACNVQDSCLTLIRFGCMDSLACNYDPSANFNIQSLCCYPGLCSDRDLSIVCPGLVNGRIGIVSVFPNPATAAAVIEWNLEGSDEQGVLSVMDLFGKPVLRYDIIPSEGKRQVDLDHLPAGTYTIRLATSTHVSTEYLLVR